MKQDIVINEPTPSPTKSNPNSYRFKCRYKDQHDDGTVKTTYPRWKDEKEAKQKKAEWLVDYGKNRGFFAPPKKVEPKILTFREYASNYEKFLLGNCKDSAHSSRKSEMKLLIDYFKDTPLHLIDREAAKNLKTYLEKKDVEYVIKTKATTRTRNPKTNRLHFAFTKKTRQTKRTVASVNSYLKRLRTLNREAVRDKKPMVAPIDFSQLILPEKNKPSTAITFGEFEQLLSVCTGERAHLYLQVLCIFQAGCRISEYKAIRKKDLNVETQFCMVNISKQKKNIEERPPRHCYFSRRLIEAIKADGYDQKGDNDFLFDTRKNERSWETAVRLAFSDTKDAERREKLLKLQMQRSLRKSAGVHYDKSGIERFIKDYQLGHAPDTTGGKHYEEVDEELQFEAFQNYEDYSARQRAKIQKAKAANV